MQPRRHRTRKQQRRDSARGWIGSGARVTIKTYRKRYGVDHYTAYDDLTALGVPLPASAEQWAERPPVVPRPRTGSAEVELADEEIWIDMDGRAMFVVGYTPGGAPYGPYLDEVSIRRNRSFAESASSSRTYGARLRRMMLRR